MATQPVSAAPVASNIACSGAPQRYYPSAKHPREVDPSDCPPVYASTAAGRCLEPVFADGETLVFDTAAEIESGDFVGFWLHPDIPHADELPRRVKRVRSIPPGVSFPYHAAQGGDVVPLVELEQLNPPRLLRVPADHILAMHKVTGTAITNGDGTARMVPLEPERLERMRETVLIRTLPGRFTREQLA
jgi:hypothetical protein